MLKFEKWNILWKIEITFFWSSFIYFLKYVSFSAGVTKPSILSYRDTFHHTINSWWIKSSSALHFFIDYPECEMLQARFNLISSTWAQCVRLRSCALRLFLYRNHSCCDRVDSWCHSVTRWSKWITTMVPKYLPN